MTPALRLQELHVPFGEAPGLRGVSLEVAAGERVAIVGASGAGKSTLLRGVAGLGPLSAGRVEIGGREVTGVPPELRDAVYLHQTPLLFPHLTVAENVAFPLRVRGERGRAVDARVAELLGSVRLQGFGERLPRTLSGGQRHRVALVRAIAARPTVLLLDEPLASLDPTLRAEVGDTIAAVQRASGAALVLVTHDLDEAATLADRVGVLLDGTIAQLDAPGELFAHPASLAVARFLGIPNQVPGRVGSDGVFACVLGRWTPPGAPLPPGPATAVFRADAVCVREAAVAHGVVIRIRHRSGGTTAEVRVSGAELEVRVDPLAPPAVGSRVGLAVETARVTVFPG